MVRMTDSYGIPRTLEEVLDIINRVYTEDLSVIDRDGTVYGALADSTTLYPQRPEFVELWLGADSCGITFESVGESLTFLQGFMTGVLLFPSDKSVADHLKALSRLRYGGTNGQRAFLIYAQFTETDINKVSFEDEELPDPFE